MLYPLVEREGAESTRRTEKILVAPGKRIYRTCGFLSFLQMSGNAATQELACRSVHLRWFGPLDDEP